MCEEGFCPPVPPIISLAALVDGTVPTTQLNEAWQTVPIGERNAATWLAPWNKEGTRYRYDALAHGNNVTNWLGTAHARWRQRGCTTATSMGRAVRNGLRPVVEREVRFGPDARAFEWQDGRACRGYRTLLWGAGGWRIWLSKVRR